jgi:hypothetical protein
MAHAKAEWRLFPVARARDVPVVAFTTTRWNSLQKGHPRWDGDPPSTATCMRWAEAHPAVQVVLNSAPDVAYLGEWADELSDVANVANVANVASVRRFPLPPPQGPFGSLVPRNLPPPPRVADKNEIDLGDEPS